MISIHAPRMGSDVLGFVGIGVALDISIHAPRMGSDEGQPFRGGGAEEISIHAPRMGSDRKKMCLHKLFACILYATH